MHRRVPLWVLGALAAVTCWCASCREELKSSTPPTPKPITLFAAASTADALTEAIKLYQSRSSVAITPSFAATSTLAQQIKAGAPADLFIAADERWMDDLASAGLLEPSSRTNLLGGELVLIAPKDHPFTVRMSRDLDVAGQLAGLKRIAVADPAAVPAGRYAQQALEYLDWWRAVKDRLVPAQDVRAALRLVEMGEADAGIVYATDGQASSKVIVIAAFPAESHQPIVYPAALVWREGAEGAPPAEARAFLEFLRSRDAAAIFTRHGFRVPSPQ